MTEKIDSTQSKTKSMGTRRWFRSWFLMVVFLLIFGAAITLSIDTVIDLRHEVMMDQVELKKLQKSLRTVEHDQKVSQTLLSVQQDELKRMKERLGFNQTTWQLEESQYILKLANFNLRYQKNTTLALALVSIAEKLLQETSLVKLQPIREQLSSISYELRALEVDNVATILSKLNTLQTKISTLELRVSSGYQKKNISNMSKKSIKGTWRDHLQSTLSELKDIVVIRYHEQPLTIGQLPLNHDYLREQLSMLLIQAAWSAIRNDEHVYHTVLEQATGWVEQYFDLENVNVKIFIQTLKQLQSSAAITSHYPDLSTVIDDIQVLLQQSMEILPTNANKENERVTS